MERTFAMVKVDGVQRKLVGETIMRLERSGLKIAALKMLRPTRDMIVRNYPDSDEWYRKVGDRSIKNFQEQGIDIVKKFGTADAIQIGKTVKNWLIRFHTSGKVVAMVLEGNRAVDNVRKLMGDPDPVKAESGTIRGDFSIDNVTLGNFTNRPTITVIHASGTVEEAKREIEIWFDEKEILSYKRDHEDVFYKEW